MKTIPLSAFFAALLLAPTLHAKEAAAPADASALPQTITRSGHQFLAHCGDEDFARARFPQKLARKCTGLLQSWRAEARGDDNWVGPPDTSIPSFGAPRGIPSTPPPSPSPSPSPSPRG